MQPDSGFQLPTLLLCHAGNGITWLWDELQQGNDLTCTVAQVLVLLQGRGRHGARDFLSQNDPACIDSSCSSLGSV